MDSFKINKMVAAVLVAGLVAMVSGFIARSLVHQDVPDQPAYMVAGMETQPAAGPPQEEELEPIVPMLASASAEEGRSVAGKCTACHSFDQGGPNKIGPNLYNIVGANVAHIDGFNYSGAMAEKEGTWGYEELNAFLHDPRRFLPGTRMTFVGLKKPEERANIIKYLMSVTQNPPPVPES
ncbi:MAG: cytochrome c family protein [Acetobacterales bacterium]